MVSKDLTIHHRQLQPHLPSERVAGAQTRRRARWCVLDTPYKASFAIQEFYKNHVFFQDHRFTCFILKEESLEFVTGDTRHNPRHPKYQHA
jgi:hypothetical protein